LPTGFCSRVAPYWSVAASYCFKKQRPFWRNLDPARGKTQQMLIFFNHRLQRSV